MAKEALKIQEGGVIDYTAAATIANGDVIPLADRVGVALDDAVIGDVISLALEGVFEITGKTADAFSTGTVVFFDDSAREITVTDTGNPAGIAITAKAGAAAGVVNVKIG